MIAGADSIGLVDIGSDFMGSESMGSGAVLRPSVCELSVCTSLCRVMNSGTGSFSAISSGRGRKRDCRGLVSEDEIFNASKASSSTGSMDVIFLKISDKRRASFLSFCVLTEYKPFSLNMRNRMGKVAKTMNP